MRIHSSVIAVALGTALRSAAAQEPPTVEAPAVEADAQPGVQADVQPDAPPEPAPAFVADVGPLPIEFHGYASQGFVASDHNNFFLNNSKHGSARFTDVALNASTQVTDKLRFVVQIASVINDAEPRPELRLDFGFADYRFSDYFGIRAGRYRILGSLYSEVIDTDIARTPIFLPSGAYEPINRQHLLSANGIDLYGTVPLGAAGSVGIVVQGGTLDDFTVTTTTIRPRWFVGGRVIYETPVPGLRVGGAVVALGGDTSTSLDSATTAQLIAAGIAPADFDGTLTFDIERSWLARGFAEWTIHKLTLSAEYQSVNAENESRYAFAPDNITHSDGFYGMASYRWSDSITTGGYASFYYKDRVHRSTAPADHQFDYAFTFRYDFNAYLAIKAELHHIDGTAQLVPALNTGTVTDSAWLFATRLSAAF